jgi:hypothetical protein
MRDLLHLGGQRQNGSLFFGHPLDRKHVIFGRKCDEILVGKTVQLIDPSRPGQDR